MKWLKSLLLTSLLALIAPFAHAAISVVQVATPVNSFGNATSQSITLTSTPTVGNYVILEMGFRNIQAGFAISSVTDNQTGNTYSAVTSGQGTSGQSAAAIYIAKVTAATGTFTITVATGTQTPNYALYAMEVSGISGATDQATTAAQNNHVTSFSVTQAGANSNASDLVVTGLFGGFFSNSAFGLTDPPSSGYTSMGLIDPGCCYKGGVDAGYKLVSSIETDSASWTTTTAMDAVAVIASFPAASGGSGGGGGSSGTGSIAYFPGTFISQWATLTANTTLSYVQPQVLCNAAAGAFTITLPTAVNSFTTYHVKKVDATANTCTIATTNAQTIDGAATKVLSTQYSSTTVVSDNSNWWIP